MNAFEKASAAISSGLRAQAYRLQLASENMANADTHGYRRKMTAFDQVYDTASRQDLVEADRVFLDPSPLKETFDPTHPFADERGYVQSSNVNIVTEFADAREATRSYEAGLQIYRQTRQMYAGLLDILKR
ncbi:MAG: flagellar basal body rod C-terminal domain-containing protein [Parvularculaceae bacterium]